MALLYKIHTATLNLIYSILFSLFTWLVVLFTKICIQRLMKKVCLIQKLGLFSFFHVSPVMMARNSSSFTAENNSDRKQCIWHRKRGKKQPEVCMDVIMNWKS